MTKEVYDALNEIIVQGEYQLKQGAVNGLVPVYVTADDLDKLKAIYESLTREGEKMSRAECRAVGDLFGRLCPSLPSVREISDARAKAIASAKKLLGKTSFEELFCRVEASDFLTGRANGWRGCGFDWVLKKANLLKILEGNYDNRKEKESKAAHDSSFDIDEFAAMAMRRTAALALQ